MAFNQETADKVTKSVTSKRKPPAKGGSRKGIPNKLTAEIKDMILQALQNAGGVGYLEDRANDPRTAAAFMSLIGKAMPLQVQGPGANGEHIFQRIVREVVDPREST